ncbi:flippase [Pontibacter chinhatensis]|uniref:Membrane protein involved in the export of O-antigen and teichoic acid n=1 Tax=Pontibacter chinhatensis TaxID=1436961 RepID=A0A1I2MTP2_9BACT|nr:flippase [Pontibacter chinhatensis]SFF94260.1 Membrane protein involved in the export of O-antigen and teichoic acid [Pontibacter chinhatensis]
MKLVERIKKPLSSAGVKKYAHNTGWLFAEQMLRMAAGFLVGLWVARYLGPDQFGIYNYVIAFTSIFAGLAKLGMDEILVRDLVNDPEKEAVYLGTAFWLKLAGAILTIALITFISIISSDDYLTVFYILIISAGIIFQSFEVLDFYFRSKVLTKYVSISKLIQLLVSSLLKVYFVVTGAELFWFVLIALIDQISLALSLYLNFYNRKIKLGLKDYNFFKYFDKSVANRLLHDGWPMILSSLAVMIYLRIDQVMIKNMVGEHVVGIYAAGVRISELFFFIPVIICSSLFPAILNAKRTEQQLFNKRLQQLYTFLTWIAILITIPVAFLSDWIVYVLYGEQFAEAGNILMISIWASIFVFQGTARGYWLVAENLQKYSLIFTSLATLVNVLLNIILIPQYGGIGAAWATLISYSSSAILFPILFKRTRNSTIQLLKSFILARA